MSTETYKVLTPYIEVEAENVRPKRYKTKLNLTLQCVCGKSVLKPGKMSVSEDHGKQKFCQCGNLIYTIGTKITYNHYVSGKPEVKELNPDEMVIET